MRGYGEKIERDLPVTKLGTIRWLIALIIHGSKSYNIVLQYKKMLQIKQCAPTWLFANDPNMPLT